MEQDFEEPRSRVLLVDKEIFKPYEYQREEEIESRVSKLVQFVFGPETIYFDIRQKMASRAKKINVTDGLLLQLRKGEPKLWVVEHELSSHDLYSHIQPQIMGFLRSLRNLETLREVQRALYEEILADEAKDKAIREFLGPRGEVFLFLDRVLGRKSGVVVVIDEITPQLTEICEDLSRYADVKVIEFKTYEKEGKEIYHFTPFTVEEEVAGAPEGREYPAYMKSWEARLEWATSDTRALVFEFTRRLESELPEICHSPKHRWYYFYKGKTPKSKSLFAVLLAKKKGLHVRIRIDPSKFEDRLNVTKQYKGWFFRARGEERGFSIKKADQLNYAMELVRQAYDYATVLSILK